MGESLIRSAADYEGIYGGVYTLRNKLWRKRHE